MSQATRQVFGGRSPCVCPFVLIRRLFRALRKIRSPPRLFAPSLAWDARSICRSSPRVSKPRDKQHFSSMNSAMQCKDFSSADLPPSKTIPRWWGLPKLVRSRAADKNGPDRPPIAHRRRSLNEILTVTWLKTKRPCASSRASPRY